MRVPLEWAKAAHAAASWRDTSNAKRPPPSRTDSAPAPPSMPTTARHGTSTRAVPRGTRALGNSAPLRVKSISPAA
eukprot:7126726-Prymnesium_polylepis.1